MSYDRRFFSPGVIFKKCGFFLRQRCNILKITFQGTDGFFKKLRGSSSYRNIVFLTPQRPAGLSFYVAHITLQYFKETVSRDWDVISEI
jgi:hypothetical protein